MYTKVNPFIQIIEAFKGLYSPESLYNLRKQSTGSKILYSIMIGVLLAIIICGWSVFTINTDKELENGLQQLPNFSYASGCFYWEESVATAAEDSYLIINTNQTEWELEKLQQQAFGNTTNGYKVFQDALNDPNVTEVMMISMKNIVTYKKYSGEFVEMSLSELFGVFGIRTFSKDIILDGYKGFVTKVGVICGVIIAPFQSCALFFSTLLLSLIALIINAICKSNESFATLYWITFYVVSVLAIIESIGADILSINDFIMSCVCLIVYIIIMVRTLQKGDVTLRPATVYNINDDLDDYLNNI